MSESTTLACNALAEIFPEASYRDIRRGVAAVLEHLPEGYDLPVSRAAWDLNIDTEKLTDAFRQICSELAGRAAP